MLQATLNQVAKDRTTLQHTWQRGQDRLEQERMSQLGPDPVQNTWRKSSALSVCTGARMSRTRRKNCSPWIKMTIHLGCTYSSSLTSSLLWSERKNDLTTTSSNEYLKKPGNLFFNIFQSSLEWEISQFKKKALHRITSFRIYSFQH